MARNSEWPNCSKTRYPEIGLTKTGPIWRFMVEGAIVGSQYKTKIEALADLRQFATDYGFTDNQGKCPRCGSPRCGSAGCSC